MVGEGNVRECWEGGGVTRPVTWNLTAPDISILSPNAGERPDQAIVDLAVQVSTHTGLASLAFAFAPLGSGIWTSILNMLPSRPTSPSTPGGPGLGAAGPGPLPPTPLTHPPRCHEH